MFDALPYCSHAQDFGINNNTNAFHLTLAVDIKRDLLSGAKKWRKWGRGGIRACRPSCTKWLLLYRLVQWEMGFEKRGKRERGF